MKSHKTISQSVYFLIWATLIILTVLTVTVTGLNFGNLGTLAAILIATVKGVLVLGFFMHLKNEAMMFKIMLCLALFTLTIIMLLTFVDISFR